MKKLLCFLTILCLAMLCGCGEKKIHVYADKDSSSAPHLVMGLSWISHGVASVLEDSTVPEDAVLTLKHVIRGLDEDASVETFWNPLGFTCAPLYPDGRLDGYYGTVYCYVRGTKAQWRHLFTAPELQDIRYQISHADTIGVMLYHYVPDGVNMGFSQHISANIEASYGVRLYAEHPEKFINPPTVSYVCYNRTCYTNAQNIPALLEREEVSQIHFVGHYMVKE